MANRSSILDRHDSTTNSNIVCRRILLLLLQCLVLAPYGSALSLGSSGQKLRVNFVTGNKMKAKEMQQILAEDGIAPPYLADNDINSNDVDNDTSFMELRVLNVDLPELQEVDTVAIAKHKVLLAAQLANGPCVVEDTSLELHALGGMPGPYIKWFQDKLKSDGLYNILAAYEDKSATAVCTLAFCPAPHADPILFTGTCKGRLVAPVSGQGFGWDSIFVPTTGDADVNDKPFSKMTTDEKNKYSHRGDAVRQWAAWLRRNQRALLERQEGLGKKPSLPGHKGLDFKAVYPEQ